MIVIANFCCVDSCAVFREQGNETSDLITGGESLDKLNDYRPLYHLTMLKWPSSVLGCISPKDGVSLLYLRTSHWNVTPYSTVLDFVSPAAM
jgi:hypothetical protein